MPEQSMFVGPSAPPNRQQRHEQKQINRTATRARQPSQPVGQPPIQTLPAPVLMPAPGPPGGIGSFLPPGPQGRPQGMPGQPPTLIGAPPVSTPPGWQGGAPGGPTPMPSTGLQGQMPGMPGGMPNLPQAQQIEQMMRLRQMRSPFAGPQVR